MKYTPAPHVDPATDHARAKNSTKGISSQNSRANAESETPGRGIKAPDLPMKGDPTKGAMASDKLPGGSTKATPLTTDVGQATSTMSKHVEHSGPREMTYEDVNPSMAAPLK